MTHFGARFGHLVARKREELGLSLAQVAVCAYGDDGQGGDSRKSDVRRLEQGASRKPNAATIKKYRLALDLTQEEIDACRSPAELQLAQFSDKLFTLIGDAVAQLGLSEDLAAALAERYAEGNPDDFDGALKGLTHALEVAAQERAKGRLPGNVSDAVEQVFQRADALNEAGEIDAATAELARLDAEHKDEIARLEQARMRIVERRIAQAVITRDVEMAVTLELEKLALEGGGFADLRRVRRGWYERGRDKGLRFDLEVAIGLARVSVERGADAEERGTGLNDLGIALDTLGERESGTARLEEAVTAYRRALEESTRDKVPLDWAMTQMNLGIALQTLGARESGTARLEEAVTAYRHALEERTRDRVPLNWARTQMNLGIALHTLGERESGTARLEEAVTAYRRALEEQTRDRVPLEWTTTQMNLGNALATLGARESGTARLEEAVTAYRLALEEWTRDRVPFNWARTQMNLGNALAILGESESGTARLEEAITAYRRALEEWTRDRVPLNWAVTQENLAWTELTFADHAAVAAPCPHLRRALTYVDAALEIFDPEASAFHHDKASALRDDLVARIEAECV